MTMLALSIASVRTIMAMIFVAMTIPQRLILLRVRQHTVDHGALNLKVSQEPQCLYTQKCKLEHSVFSREKKGSMDA